MTERIVIAGLRGGLGNQMFEYAHGLAVAKRCGAILRLRWEEQSAVSRAFALGQFGIKLEGELPPAAEICHIADFGPYRSGMEHEIPEKFLCSGKQTCHLQGYFQNEKLFAFAADEVRSLFSLDTGTPLIPAGSTPVAVHVRRTDFLKHRHHAICGLPYFLTAIKVMKSLIPSCHFLVFSDDPEWCRINFASIDNLEVRPAAPDHIDFADMLACSAFIIPNSTFSWWAAWLTGSGVVISPSRFLGDREWPLIPDRWIQLPPDGIMLQRKSDRL